MKNTLDERISSRRRRARPFHNAVVQAFRPAVSGGPKRSALLRRFVRGLITLYEITIDDPKIFTAPWTQELEIVAKPAWDSLGLFEYVCEENNRCPGGRCG